MKVTKVMKCNIELTDEETQSLKVVNSLINQYCDEVVDKNCNICPFEKCCNFVLADIFTSYEL